MNKLSPAAYLLVAYVLAAPLRGSAQDNITIPKSRLEELERKEKELEQLRKQPSVSDMHPVAPKAAISSNAIPQGMPAPVMINHPSPPMESLPSLAEGATVEAMDLANYYRQDSKTADARFKNRDLKLRGQIVGFEKPMLRRDYKVLLQSGDLKTHIACELFPPEKFTSVFTVSHGSELVGLQSETRVPIAKVGQTILVTGKCKGFSDDTVRFYGTAFEIAKEQPR